MRIPIIYRSAVPVVGFWQGYDEFGLPINVYSDIQYKRGNLQPLKQGFEASVDGSGIRYEDWLVFYSTNDMMPTPPASVDPSTPMNNWWFWDYEEERWLQVQAYESWRRSGRGPKHLRAAGQYSAQSQPAVSDPVAQ